MEVCLLGVKIIIARKSKEERAEQRAERKRKQYEANRNTEIREGVPGIIIDPGDPPSIDPFVRIHRW